jgi:hypothetical protein
MIRRAGREAGWTVVLALLAAGGCRARGGRDLRRIPSGIAIEFTDGAAAVPRELEARLLRIGVDGLFVPAVRLVADGNGARVEGIAPPEAPYLAPVYLEAVGAGELAPYFAEKGRRAGEVLWRALTAAAESGRYGRVAGLHLALGIPGEGEGFGKALAVLRRRMPDSWTLSTEIRAPLRGQAAGRWASWRRYLDFAVPWVFGRLGRPGGGPPASADVGRLSRSAVPLLPGYAPQGWGAVEAAGRPDTWLPDSVVNELSENPRFDFSFGDVLGDPDENVYVFTATGASRGGPAGVSWRVGDRVTFRERRTADFVRALAASRSRRARIVRLESLADGRHLIGFAVLEDILLGRPVRPALSITRLGTTREASLVVLNASAECSELSRLHNWVEIRVEGGPVADVRPGGFDRYEIFDAAGRPADPARARRIRFYENFIAPGESITSGPIRLRAPARLYASAHVTLPDGSVLTIPESPLGIERSGR